LWWCANTETEKKPETKYLRLKPNRIEPNLKNPNRPSPSRACKISPWFVERCGYGSPEEQIWNVWLSCRFCNNSALLTICSYCDVMLQLRRVLHDGVFALEHVVSLLNHVTLRLVTVEELTCEEICGVAMVLRTAAGEELDMLDTYMDMCTTPEHATIETIQTVVCVSVTTYHTTTTCLVALYPCRPG